MEQHIYSADAYCVAVVLHHPWALVYLLDLLLLLYTAPGAHLMCSWLHLLCMWKTHTNNIRNKTLAALATIRRSVQHLPACCYKKAILFNSLGLLFSGLALMQLLLEPEIRENSKLWHASNPGQATKDSQLLTACDSSWTGQLFIRGDITWWWSKSTVHWIWHHPIPLLQIC